MAFYLQCIHRDLAARNVLLGKDNIPMVSDFGLSRDVYESGQYEKTTGVRIKIATERLIPCTTFNYDKLYFVSR